MELTPVDLFAVSDLTSRTLIGAAVGGLLGAVLTLTITGRRERRKTRMEDLAAVRMVEFELGNAKRAAADIRDTKAPYVSFPITAWESGRLHLARSLEPLEWLLVLDAYDAVNGFNWRYRHDLDASSREPRPDSLLTQEDIRDRVCSRIVESADAAARILRAKG